MNSHLNDLYHYARLFIGRRSDFALQQENGAYYRVGRVLTARDVRAHLDGAATLGTYVINEAGRCRAATFDADSDGGLEQLHMVQTRLAEAGIPAYLEQSRRGGHLWVFFAEPARASLVRRWLLPYCPAGIEFYPKQAEGAGYGSLIRLPFGIHRKSGKRYPFVEWSAGGPGPVARTIGETLAWLNTVPRVRVPALDLQPWPEPRARHAQDKSPSYRQHTTMPDFPPTIRDWCAAYNPVQMIGSYVDLDHQGRGWCPFGEHHAGGCDTHASLKVYQPDGTSNYCWYCYAWQQGGSLFDFLRHWYRLDARELWRRLQRKEITA